MDKEWFAAAAANGVVLMQDQYRKQWQGIEKGGQS